MITITTFFGDQVFVIPHEAGVVLLDHIKSQQLAKEHNFFKDVISALTKGIKHGGDISFTVSHHQYMMMCVVKAIFYAGLPYKFV